MIYYVPTDRVVVFNLDAECAGREDPRPYVRVFESREEAEEYAPGVRIVELRDYRYSRERKMGKPTATLIKRLDPFRILWRLNRPLIAAEGDEFYYVITVINGFTGGAYAYFASPGGKIADSRMLPESVVPEMSHVQSLLALGYEVAVAKGNH